MVKRVCAVLVCGAFLLVAGAPATAAADDAQSPDKPRVVKPATDTKNKVKAPAKKPAASSKRDQASAVGFGPNGGAQGPEEEPWQARPNPVDSKGVTGAAGSKKAAQAPETLRDPVRGAQRVPAR